MKYTLIDSDNYATSQIKTFFFPGGEPHATLPQFEGPILFYGKLRTWNDMGFAACVLSALNHQKNISAITIFIPYFPGARQDRSDGTAPFTIEFMARILEQNRLYIFDGHSDVVYDQTGALQLDWLDLPSIERKENNIGIIIPDKGAKQRALNYRDRFYPHATLVQGLKERDPATGYLVYNYIDPLPYAGHYIIPDDICDGGMTFNLLMKMLSTDRLYDQCTFELLVSHGIFSKGLQAIDPKITKITTTDSWCKKDPTTRLQIVSLSPLFNMIMDEK